MTVPWDDDAQRGVELNEQARKAQEEGRLNMAAELFRQYYTARPSAYAASRYLNCMRQQGAEQARTAVRFAREPVERWPLDSWLTREYCWAIYDGYLKQAPKGDEDEALEEEPPGFEVRVKAARRILKLSGEPLQRLRTVFAVCREAKARKQWDLVLEFAQALDAEKLSDEQREENGQYLPSDRQRWLYLLTRAHLELGHYTKCVQLAQEGMARYPNAMFFRWWNALAQVRQGQVDAGLRELRQVQQQYSGPWYLPRDIAEAYELLQQDETAWRWYCVAASSPGELKNRTSMLARMAQPLARLQRWSLALDHLLLAWALSARELGREKQTERLREQVEGFLQHHAAQLGCPATLPVAPPDPEPLLESCRQAWAEPRR